MRNMSFMATKQQIRDKTKFVTRRIGWKFAKPGDLERPVEKAQGLKKGEKIKLLLPPDECIMIIGTRWEPLNSITRKDVILEGFPRLETYQFVDMFCKMNKSDRTDPVNRIEFGYIYIPDYEEMIARLIDRGSDKVEAIMAAKNYFIDLISTVNQRAYTALL